MWAAADFSENEIRNEMLCARFKNPEIASQFEDAFNRAVSSSKDGGSPQKPKSVSQNLRHLQINICKITKVWPICSGKFLVHLATLI